MLVATRTAELKFPPTEARNMRRNGLLYIAKISLQAEHNEPVMLGIDLLRLCIPELRGSTLNARQADQRHKRVVAVYLSVALQKVAAF